MTSIRSTLRVLAALSATTTVLGLAACSGFSEEEANNRCEQERVARSGEMGCFGNVEFNKCVTAYEECGQDVDVVDGCPVQYNCPSDGDEETETAAE